MRWTSRIAIVAVFASFSGARAGPVLIARYDESAWGATAPQTLARVEFVLQLAEDVPIIPPVQGTGLGAGVWWEDGDQGTIDFTVANTNGFDVFADRATDGINGPFASLTTFWEGNTHGIIGLEDALFSSFPDLLGYDLSLVRLTVHDVRFQPLVIGSYDGFSVESEVSYEFYGAPVPEPPMCVLIMIGCVLIGPVGRARADVDGVDDVPLRNTRPTWLSTREAL